MERMLDMRKFITANGYPVRLHHHPYIANHIGPLDYAALVVWREFFPQPPDASAVTPFDFVELIAHYTSYRIVKADDSEVRESLQSMVDNGLENDDYMVNCMRSAMLMILFDEASNEQNRLLLRMIGRMWGLRKVFYSKPVSVERRIALVRSKMLKMMHEERDAKAAAEAKEKKEARRGEVDEEKRAARLAWKEQVKRNVAEARAKQARARYLSLWRRAIKQVLADLAAARPVVALDPKGKKQTAVVEVATREDGRKLPTKKRHPARRGPVEEAKREAEKSDKLASLAAAKEAKAAAAEADAAARQARADARRLAREIGGW